MERIRKRHLDTILKEKASHRILIIGGLPGTGRKDFLAAVIHRIKAEKPPVRIVDLRQGEEVSNQDIIQQSRGLGVGPSVLVLDDADGINGLGEALSKVIAEYSVTVFMTARHIQVLNDSLRPLFGNLLYTLRLPPLSYTEFLEANNLRDSVSSIEQYGETGGLIHHTLLPPSSPDRFTLLRFRADSFLLREIIERFTVRNPLAMRELLSFIARHIGESISARQVQEALSNRKMTISPQAVLDYLGYCAESGLLVPVPVYDLTRKKTLDSGMSWYFGDSGLRNAFSRRTAPQDHTLANLVFLHLVDSGWSVQQGRIIRGNGTREDISFVCEKNQQRLYLQMEGSNATAAEQMRKRSALLSIRDNWPKYLVGAYSGEDNVHDGIRRMSVRELLLQGE